MRDLFVKLVLFSSCFAVLFFPVRLLAWGPGHDHVNRLALKILPAEILEQLPEAIQQKIVKLSHAPDDFTPWEKWNKLGMKIVPADMELLKAYKIKTPYDLHSAKGQAVNLILLTNSFKDKSPERIALWMACLMHTHADEAAANHDPLIGCMQYTFAGEYKMRIGKGVGFDFANIAKDKTNQRMIEDLLVLIPT